MIYISGFREYQCRDYARWLGLKPTEWRYVNRAAQFMGARGELFIELDGMYNQDEYWDILREVKYKEFIHVVVE